MKKHVDGGDECGLVRAAFRGLQEESIFKLRLERKDQKEQRCVGKSFQQKCHFRIHGMEFSANFVLTLNYLK